MPEGASGCCTGEARRAQASSRVEEAVAVAQTWRAVGPAAVRALSISSEGRSSSVARALAFAFPNKSVSKKLLIFNPFPSCRYKCVSSD